MILIFNQVVVVYYSNIIFIYWCACVCKGKYFHLSRFCRILHERILFFFLSFHIFMHNLMTIFSIFILPFISRLWILITENGVNEIFLHWSRWKTIFSWCYYNKRRIKTQEMNIFNQSASTCTYPSIAVCKYIENTIRCRFYNPVHVYGLLHILLL